MVVSRTASSQRGRPRTGEREQRRLAVIDAAFEELVERGADNVTMLSIARRAGASKETLYSWFGSREGLLAEMISGNADQTAARIEGALANGGDARATLTDFGIGLLRLLTDERSLALNRAAMSTPGLADELLRSGRHRVGPIVERYLDRLAGDGSIALGRDDAAAAFTVFYGLLVRDTQIRVLLGETAPSGFEVSERADVAVEQFMTLYAAHT